MEYVFGAMIGVGVGFIFGILTTQESVSKKDVHEPVDRLHTQAQKNLQEFQEKRQQITQLHQKADVIRTELKTRVNELAEQE